MKENPPPPELCFVQDVSSPPDFSSVSHLHSASAELNEIKSQLFVQFAEETLQRTEKKIRLSAVSQEYNQSLRLLSFIIS